MAKLASAGTIREVPSSHGRRAVGLRIRGLALAALRDFEDGVVIDLVMTRLTLTRGLQEQEKRSTVLDSFSVDFSCVYRHPFDDHLATPDSQITGTPGPGTGVVSNGRRPAITFGSRIP